MKCLIVDAMSWESAMIFIEEKRRKGEEMGEAY